MNEEKPAEGDSEWLAVGQETEVKDQACPLLFCAMPSIPPPVFTNIADREQAGGEPNCGCLPLSPLYSCSLLTAKSN